MRRRRQEDEGQKCSACGSGSVAELYHLPQGWASPRITEQCRACGAEVVLSEGQSAEDWLEQYRREAEVAR